MSGKLYLTVLVAILEVMMTGTFAQRGQLIGRFLAPPSPPANPPAPPTTNGNATRLLPSPPNNGTVPGNMTTPVPSSPTRGIMLQDSTIFLPADVAFSGKTIPSFTIAPTTGDNAFAGLGISVNFLRYHVVHNTVLRSTDIPAGTTVLPSAYTPFNLTVVKSGQNITVKGNNNSTPATVLAADITFGSNIVHIIDQVLVP